MASCDDIRELFGDLADGSLSDDLRQRVDDHLAVCDECRQIRETIDLISATIPNLDALEPPAHLEGDLATSPCRRWLGLLFQAVDREISQYNLERLLTHMESCEACARAWKDLSLMHQVGEAMEPPRGFVQRCIDARRRILRRPIISRRAVTAAAYLMAVLVSLLIGNPVSVARSPIVQRVTETATTTVNQAAEQGSGELKVMLWRAWKWTGRAVDSIEKMIRPGQTDTTSADSQGET